MKRLYTVACDILDEPFAVPVIVAVICAGMIVLASTVAFIDSLREPTWTCVMPPGGLGPLEKCVPWPER